MLPIYFRCCVSIFLFWIGLLLVSFAIPASAVSQTDVETERADAAVEADAKKADANDELNLTNANSKLLWVFLSCGKSLEKVDSEKIKKMQSDHLQNCKRLAEQGKLLYVGSVTDPVETLQGVAVFAPDNKESLMELFQDDELIRGGFRKLQVASMRLEHGSIKTAKNDRSGMQEYRMVVLEKSDQQSGSEESQLELVSESRKFLKSMFAEKDLRLAIRLGENRPGREQVLIFDKPAEEGSIKARVQKIPAVKDGLWKTRILPIFFGKGTLNQS